jgi:hypothetical protein
VKKLLTASLFVLAVTNAVASTYLLPPDIDDLRQAVKSPVIVTISHSTRTDTHPFTINLNGAASTVYYDCIKIQKIDCKMGTWDMSYSISSYQGMEKETYSSTTYMPAKITNIDIKFYDEGDTFLVCGMMGTTNGNALLTDHDTPDNYGNPGVLYDPNNPSFLMVKVTQTCK